MSLLTVISGTLARLALPTTTAVIDSTDATVRQLLQLAQREGRELARRATWKALQTEKTFTTVATAAQTSALPTDLDWIIPDTMFNRTLKRRVQGPVGADEWQLIQSSLSSSVFPAFRIRGTSLLITPTPTAGQTVAYEYMSKYWCASSAGSGQTAWAADADTALLDEELITSGLVWRFKAAKGLGYAADQQAYEIQVMQAIMREGVRPRISTDPMARFNKRGADAIAGARPDVIVTEAGDFVGWD